MGDIEYVVTVSVVDGDSVTVRSGRMVYAILDAMVRMKTGSWDPTGVDGLSFRPADESDDDLGSTTELLLRWIAYVYCGDSKWRPRPSCVAMSRMLTTAAAVSLLSRTAGEWRKPANMADVTRVIDKCTAEIAEAVVRTAKTHRVEMGEYCDEVFRLAGDNPT